MNNSRESTELTEDIHEKVSDIHASCATKDDISQQQQSIIELESASDGVQQTLNEQDREIVSCFITCSEQFVQTTTFAGRDERHTSATWNDA